MAVCKQNVMIQGYSLQIFFRKRHCFRVSGHYFAGHIINACHCSYYSSDFKIKAIKWFNKLIVNTNLKVFIVQ